MFKTIDKDSIDKLEAIKLPYRACIEKILELTKEYDRKTIIASVPNSIANSVRKTIGTIHYSSNALEGYYIMCDEIDPVKFTEFLLEHKQYDIDKEILLYFVNEALKKAINSFYREIIAGQVSFGRAMYGNTEKQERYRSELKLRFDNGVKILRSRRGTNNA